MTHCAGCNGRRQVPHERFASGYPSSWKACRECGGTGKAPEVVDLERVRADIGVLSRAAMTPRPSEKDAA